MSKVKFYGVGFSTIARSGWEKLAEAPRAPSNYKDPVKIAEYLRQAELKAQDGAAQEPMTNQVTSLHVCCDGVVTSMSIVEFRNLLITPNNIFFTFNKDAITSILLDMVAEGKDLLFRPFVIDPRLVHADPLLLADRIKVDVPKEVRGNVEKVNAYLASQFGKVFGCITYAEAMGMMGVNGNGSYKA